jgi:hypothetical protein
MQGLSLIVGRVRAVAEACLRPSAVMLVTAGVVVAAFLVWLALITPRTLHAVVAAYPGFDQFDQSYYLFDRLTKLRASDDEGSMRIAIVGGSTTEQSVWTEASFADRVSHQVGRLVTVADLSSPAQSLTVSWALVEQTLCRGYDYALVAVNLGRFAWNDTNDPAVSIGYPSRRVDAKLKMDRKPFSNWYFFRNQGFVVRTLYLLAHRAVYDLTGASRLPPPGVTTTDRHPFLGSGAWPTDRKAARIRFVLDRYDRTYPRAKKATMATLTAMANTARQCGGRLIFIETPRNPWLLDKPEYADFQALFAEQAKKTAAFAAARNIPLIDPNDVVDYEQADLNDQGHLRREGAIRATEAAIADGVALYILKQGKGQNGGVAQWQQRDD